MVSFMAELNCCSWWRIGPSPPDLILVGDPGALACNRRMRTGWPYSICRHVPHGFRGFQAVGFQLSALSRIGATERARLASWNEVEPTADSRSRTAQS